MHFRNKIILGFWVYKLWTIFFEIKLLCCNLISVKYAGVLSIGLFGLMIGYELWLLMCDRTVNVVS